MLNSNQAFLLVQTLKSAPQRALTLGVKAEKTGKKKKFQSAPSYFKMLNLMGLVH
jgi:hypothetical protein